MGMFEHVTSIGRTSSVSILRNQTPSIPIIKFDNQSWPWKKDGIRKTHTFHGIIDGSRSVDDPKQCRMRVKKFTGIVAFQLLSWGSKLLQDNIMSPTNHSISTIQVDGPSLAMSDLTLSLASSSEACHPIRTLFDANNEKHSLCKLPIKVTMGKYGKRSYTMKRCCKVCLEKGFRRDVLYYCHECGMEHNFCAIDKYNKDRDCFREHVRMITRTLKRRRTGSV